MMREILFRGKRTDTGEWIEGYFEKYNGCAYINLQTERLNSGGYPIREFVKAIPETVGQYTGLTDKNGKKIFEGDILKGVWGTVFQVVYDDCYLGFRAKEKDGMHNCIDYYGLDRLEIIGNIHDNPELLKGGA